MASEIRVNKITHTAGVGTITTSADGIVVAGIVTANNFSGNLTGTVTGSGANLTSLPAGQLTGTVADARLSTVSSSKLSGALPALDGSALTGVGHSFGNSSINTSGIITATAFIPSQGQLSNRNKIINGGMKIFQRGTSAQRSGGDDGYYYGIADRWAIRMHSSVAQTSYSKDTSNNPEGFGSNQKSVRSNAGSSNAGKYYVFDTKLEGQDLQDFAKGTSDAKEFTLSFYVKTGVSGVYTCELRDLDNTRTVVKQYTVSNGNWNRYTLTFPGDTTGKFDNNNGASLWVRFWLAAGTNFTSGTSQTTWASSVDANICPGQTAQVGDNVADTWQITGVQLEVGSVATPFEHKSFIEDKLRCYRYYYKPERSSNQLDLNGAGHRVADTMGAVVQAYPWPVEMRVSPTVSFDDNAGNSNRFAVNGSDNNTYTNQSLSLQQNVQGIMGAFQYPHGLTGISENESFRLWAYNFNASAEL